MDRKCLVRRMGSNFEGDILHCLSVNNKGRIYLGLFFAAFLLTGWIWRPSISPTLHSDRHVDGSGIELSESVCWREKPLTGHDGVGVVEITGGGCGDCHVGRTCHFQLHFHHPTPFKLIGHNISHPDLMITITGPTVFHATAREVAGDTWDGGLRFEATYTTWDAGNYTAFAESGCAWGSEPTYHHPLATWALQVKEASSLLPSPSPCHLGQLARWVPNDAPEEVAAPAPAPDPSWPSSRGNDLDLVRRSDWKLGYYDCAAVQGEAGGAGFETVPAALLDAGIREMSFIGDSHMRALVFSLVYGIMVAQDPGYLMEMSWHVNRVWDLPVMRSPKTLRINFYWLGGLYEEEGPYGCTRWGLESGWPLNYSSSSDVVVMDGGAWALQGCTQPRAALARSLPHFLETIMAIEHKPETMFVWRSVPPFPLPTLSCAANPTRSTDLVWANDLFRTVGNAFQVHFFDFWALEAPRYTETCRFYDKSGAVKQDHHFVCMLHGWEKVWGAVGMDTAEHFLELVRRTAQSERANAGE